MGGTPWHDPNNTTISYTTNGQHTYPPHSPPTRPKLFEFPEMKESPSQSRGRGVNHIAEPCASGYAREFVGLRTFLLCCSCWPPTATLILAGSLPLRPRIRTRRMQTGRHVGSGRPRDISKVGRLRIRAHYTPRRDGFVGCLTRTSRHWNAIRV